MEEIKVLESTDKNYPKSLLKIKGSPKRLYVKGNEKLLNKESIAKERSRQKCGNRTRV